MVAGQIRTGFPPAPSGSCSWASGRFSFWSRLPVAPSWSSSPLPASYFMYILCGQWPCGSWSRATRDGPGSSRADAQVTVGGPAWPAVWGDCGKGSVGQRWSGQAGEGRPGLCRNSSGLCCPFLPPRHHLCQYLKKLHTQERAVEEVKLAIKPYYQKKDITKEEYKDILRKAVHKVGPGGEQGRRGGAEGEKERRTRTDGCTRMGTREWWVCLEGEEGDGICSSPPGPILLASGVQVGVLAWNRGQQLPS